MLGGIFYGTTYGGSTASILLNVPGTPANAITCLDGYPMARQGRAGVALLATTFASWIGGTAGVVLLMVAAPAPAAALKFGALPGTGGMVAAFVSYALEKRISRTPERFGNGAIEGIVGPESANNAGDQAAFIPTLALGIPGNATMAIMLGVLIIHGITPGPGLVNEQPRLFRGVIMSFWIGYVILVILNAPFVGLWVRLLSIPYRLMFPAVIAFVCVGVYTLRVNPQDVFIVGGIGLGAVLLRQLGMPMAPMMLGFVLGPLMEQYFRRSMILTQGDLTTFFTRPISLSLMLLTGLLIPWSVWAVRRARPLPA